MEFPVQDKQGNPLPHPSFDDPNFDVRDRQQGDVWFLAETSPVTVRTCDIPLEKSLFRCIAYGGSFEFGRSREH